MLRVDLVIVVADAGLEGILHSPLNYANFKNGIFPSALVVWEKIFLKYFFVMENILEGWQVSELAVAVAGAYLTQAMGLILSM